MSVVIVGGNERMVCQYEDICKGFGCKAKVFAKEKGAMKKKIGVPDLMILFTSTVSHKMVNCAVEEAKKKSIPVCRCHTSSAAALENIFEAVLCIRNRSGDTFLLYNLTFFAEMLRKGLQNYKLFNKIAVGFCGKALQ